ncbi:TfoX/Sxy family protein [Ramlibacter rhizophilus]|uniref:TfoX family protein n=1 Tax=Ramlibacter rhizophilus TaxID=1781167 RepID=A0A4Z0BJT5_9BURK|nr:TfoX/Sxy family protein [Ramlibacter rhizophilus]TFY98673.1 TfoX family protein [Ramlibacter rhizophilus]
MPSPARRAEFAEYCAELLASAGAVQLRRMFGGHGLYVDGLFVAIITGERLYLKADAETAPAFERAGGQRFSHRSRERVVSLQFWTPPAEAMDSPALMQPWGRLALAAALRARSVPKPGRRRAAT